MNTTQTTKRALGFYVGIVAAVLCIVAAVLYYIYFPAMDYKEQVYDSSICVLLIVAAVAAIVLLLVPKLSGFAPVLLCVGSGIAAMKFIHMIIWPISDTIYGIEPFEYLDQLITCAVVIVLSFLVSEVSLYLKKVKPVKAA